MIPRLLRIPRSWVALVSAAALIVPVWGGPAVAGAPDVRTAGSADGQQASERGCRDVPVANPVSVGGTCPGVRPGAAISTRTGGCTMNFLFRGGDGRRYIATAGHCILRNHGRERTWRPGKGPIARDRSGASIGRFRYAVYRGINDFALVRLRKGVTARARMCHFGGPTGINDSRGPLFVRLQFYGNGVLVGSLTPGRSAVALGMPDPRHVSATGPAAFGDSGAGVTTPDGRAVGVLITVGAHLGRVTTQGADVGLIGITRLTPQVERASQALGIRLTLRTASRL